MRYVILFLAFVVSACSSSGHVDENKLFLKPLSTIYFSEQMEEEKNYSINAMKHAYVGEPVIKKKTFLVKLQSELFAIPEMTSYLTNRNVDIELIKDRPYQIKSTTTHNGRFFNILEYPIAKKEKFYGVLYDKAGMMYNRVTFGGHLLDEGLDINPLSSRITEKWMSKVISRENVENFEIIFGGINNNQINMVYREFNAGDVAKTAFFQELTYPVNSEFVRYKSLKIKIHKINGEGISFEVLED